MRNEEGVVGNVFFCWADVPDLPDIPEGGCTFSYSIFIVCLWYIYSIFMVCCSFG